jgi:hypothetical protein
MFEKLLCIKKKKKKRMSILKNELSFCKAFSNILKIRIFCKVFSTKDGNYVDNLT